MSKMAMTQSHSAPALKKKADSRHGLKTGGNCTVGNEERFKWQKPVNDFDAFYNLPSALSLKHTSFGSSTRQDWESTVKNKRDGNNPNAGPGNYNTTNFQALSTNRGIANNKFGQATRPSMDMKTLSPGPAYDVTDIWNSGRDKVIKAGFNKDKRKGLSDNTSSRTDASYYPELPKGKSVSILTKIKTEKKFMTMSPGPIYDTQKYDFRTGPRHSFGASKAKRFSGPGSVM